MVEILKNILRKCRELQLKKQLKILQERDMKIQFIDFIIKNKLYKNNKRLCMLESRRYKLSKIHFKSMNLKLWKWLYNDFHPYAKYI